LRLFKSISARKVITLSQSEKVYIIGIGDDGFEGLTNTAQQLINSADLLIGSKHATEMVPNQDAERYHVGGDLDEVIDKIHSTRDQKTVLLASGDPLFYGVARYLWNKLGKDQFEVVPHVSSMQLAFARVKETWEEAFLTNLATRTIENVIEQIRIAEKVGLFTTESSPPNEVASHLLDRGIDYFSGYVCENLGSPDELVTQGRLSELAAMEFGPLHCMILVRDPDAPDRPSDQIGIRLFGNPDEAFYQSKPKRGLLTPSEVRTMALAEMDLGSASTVWDIGAGSGSMGIEAARIAPEGTTYAIEMDAEDFELIQQNAEKFKVTNLVAIHGRAPEAWSDLPDPDSIFIGGTGHEVGRLVDLAYDRLKPGGRMVANVGSVESLNAAHSKLIKHGNDVKVWMVNLSRGNYQLERIRFESLNPTFLISTVKP
jgi:precorrin-6Y C5,15-methyltransferase (decarboxylating)